MEHVIYLCVIVAIIIVAVCIYNNKQTGCCRKCQNANSKKELELIALNGVLAKTVLETQGQQGIAEKKYKIVYKELLELNFFDREFYGRQLLSRRDSYVKQYQENSDDFELQAKAEFYEKICEDFSFLRPDNQEKVCCSTCSKCGAKALTANYVIL